MRDAEVNGPEDAGLTRRKLIRRGMVVGGVALWATPVAAIAQRELRQSHVDARKAALDARAAATAQAGTTNPTTGGGVTVASHGGCGGYPPGTCLTFDCGQAPHTCGVGAGGFICFCDVDINGNCVCVNDAFCSSLPSCANCPPGWFCIPSSCCGVPKCAPPCGTAAPTTTGGFATAGAGTRASGR